MFCPFCTSEETKVVDSRLAEDGEQVRRRRECLGCHERFTTREVTNLEIPRVVKRDGRCCGFSDEKLRKGMLKALEKRPVAVAEVDRAVQRMMHEIQVRGEREVSTQLIGELVMRELRLLDQVAYVRFASIYKSFQDVSEFHQEIEQLKKIHEYEK
jgi:transcriptional repressor NrdR